MQSTQSWIFGVGLLAQLLFSARVLYQWIVTEKARKVLSPPAFWVLSIIGSYLLFIYGVLRDDFSIILGQFLSYYVYLWNLNMQKLWEKIAGIVKVMLLLTPVAAVAYMLRDPSSFDLTFFHNKDIPLWLLIFGFYRSGHFLVAFCLSMGLRPYTSLFGSSTRILDMESDRIVNHYCVCFFST